MIRSAQTIRDTIAADLFARYVIERNRDKPAAEALRRARELVRLPSHLPYFHGSRILGERFDAYPGEKVTARIGRFQVSVSIEHDSDMGPPWENAEGHGPVSDWTTRDKRPGERILSADGSLKRFYDVQEATAIAKRDGWDAPPYKTGTKGERAARAVQADFDNLREWCNDQWFYVGLVVKVSVMGVELGSASLWGLESNCEDYIAECAPDLIREAIEDAQRTRRKLAA